MLNISGYVTNLVIPLRLFKNKLYFFRPQNYIVYFCSINGFKVEK